MNGIGRILIALAASLFLCAAAENVTQHPANFIYYPTPDVFAMKFRYSGVNNIPRFDCAARTRLRKAYAMHVLFHPCADEDAIGGNGRGQDGGGTQGL